MMRKFQDLVKEYEFVSLEELVCYVVDDFDEEDMCDLTLVVSGDEVQDYLVSFISTGVFKPVMIDFDSDDGFDYTITLLKYCDNTEILIERYRDNVESVIDDDSGFMVSQSVKTSTYKKILKKNSDFILYDIKE